MEALYGRLDELASIDLDGATPAVLAPTAVALHHAYGALEAALARVARTLEGSVPQGPDWHQRLLHSMTLEIPSVRSAVLSDASAKGLRRLLAFRQFFRHAYAVSWDAAQLAALRETALSLREPVARDVEGLDESLAAIAESLAAAGT